jgi:hypothetical protein
MKTRKHRRQMAGSYYDWFEERGPWRVLIGYIGDTTREMFGRGYDCEQ